MHCPGAGANICFSDAVSSCCASAMLSCTSLGRAAHQELILRCIRVQPGAHIRLQLGVRGVAAARAAPRLVVWVEAFAAARLLHLLQRDLKR